MSLISTSALESLSIYIPLVQHRDTKFRPGLVHQPDSSTGTRSSTPEFITNSESKLGPYYSVALPSLHSSISWLRAQQSRTRHHAEWTINASKRASLLT